MTGAQEPIEFQAFAELFPPRGAKSAPVRQLHALLIEAQGLGSFAERKAWLEKLALFCRNKKKVARVEIPREYLAHPFSARFWLFLRALEEAPPLREACRSVVDAVVAEATFLALFSRTGLPAEQGFLLEVADRALRKLLPAAPDERNAAELVFRLFPGRREADWVESVPADAWRRWVGVMRDPAASSRHPFESVRWEMIDALALLVVRTAALGLSDDVRVRSPEVPLRSSPFLRLPRAAEVFLDSYRAKARGDLAARVSDAQAACQAVIAECRKVVGSVFGHLEEFGVSVDLVFRLETITQGLDRIDALMGLVAEEASSDPGTPLPEARFFAELIRGGISDHSVSFVLSRSAHRLARKIVERSGETGEHYITRTRKEYGRMLLSAAGGGALTAGTAALKFLVAWAKLPALVEGLGHATNYAASFLGMQLLGFTLATKQPSMTAAALARALEEREGIQSGRDGIELISQIVRSQLAAAIGNVGVVIPCAALIDLGIRTVWGRAFLDEATARYVVHSFHPWATGTLFYAALTGGLLWASSVAAGWLENWAVYRRLPEAISKHRTLVRVVGPEGARRVSRFFSRNVSGFGGNVALGVLLGFVPVFGKISGLPLDVRHVTLSTGALVFAGVSLGPAHVLTEDFALAALGIALVGVLNFVVSFLLALAVALRAREVSLWGSLRLLARVAGHFLRSPSSFLWPPREAA